MKRNRFIILSYIGQLCIMMFLIGLAFTLFTFVDKDLIPTLPYVIVATFFIAWFLYHKKIKQNAIELYDEFKE